MDRRKLGAAVFMLMGLAFGVGLTVSLMANVPAVEDGNDRAQPATTEQRGPDTVGPYGPNSTPGGSRYAEASNITTFYDERLVPEEPWFDEVSGELEFDYRSTPGPYFEGESVSGVFVADVDSDYRDDLLAVGGGSPVLFENTGGVFQEMRTFETSGNVTSAVFFDQDNDGYPELYLLSDEDPIFYDNEGGRYVERDVGLPEGYASVRGASAADYTGNGCLDLFVVQAGDWTERRPVGYDNKNVSISEDNGGGNRLFRGDCEGFTETTRSAGLTGEAWSLTSSFVDLTGDGLPDVHVANDFNNDVVYVNEGDGSFERNVLSDATNRNGMSSEVFDVDGDGLLDIFVTNVHHGVEEGPVARRFGGRVDGNNLLINQGDGDFVDRAEEWGVRVGGWGWAAVFADFTLDGEPDLVHAVSAVHEYPALWRGGAGSSFGWVDASAAGLEKSRGYGIAELDVDSDGSPDLVVSDRGRRDGRRSRYLLYRNRNVGPYLRVIVDDVSEGTDMGTRVKVQDEDGNQIRVKHSEVDYMSQSTRAMNFGVNGREVDLTVEWPDGRVDRYPDLEVNRTVVLERGSVERVCEVGQGC